MEWNDTMTAGASSGFDHTNVNLETANPRDVICFLSAESEESTGDPQHGARISAIFVVLVISTIATMFPVVAARTESLRIPLYVYLAVRYFGAGVIIATAFIHLLDPAYSAIGPNSCVGMTGTWADYSWPPAIAMTSAMCVFLLDFLVECHVQSKLGVSNEKIHGDVEAVVTVSPDHHSHDANRQKVNASHDDDEEEQHDDAMMGVSNGNVNNPPALPQEVDASLDEKALVNTDGTKERTFEEQIGAFLVLELGVIFHSIIIGLNLGVAESEFRSLYPVLVFHQAFEGLGIGARLSDIPFPRRFRVVPWVFCVAYGLTTPIAIAVGIAVRSTYRPDSFTASVVAGVFDSISAGILLYTGFVELLARDFLFHPERARDKFRVSFMITCLYLGIAIMGLLGKWA